MENENGHSLHRCEITAKKLNQGETVLLHLLVLYYYGICMRWFNLKVHVGQMEMLETGCCHAGCIDQVIIFFPHFNKLSSDFCSLFQNKTKYQQVLLHISEQKQLKKQNNQHSG